MKPIPWSPSSLSDFVNCPRSFYEKRILKSVKQEDTEQTIWGNKVHKAFEERHLNGTPLPPDLDDHEAFMLQLTVIPGQHYTEQKIALSTALTPCGFFDDNVFMRAIIDYLKVTDDRALIVDYKTGKPHNKFGQLKLNALWVFQQHPAVQKIKVMYYWTKTMTVTDQQYARADIPALWADFVPDLKQYKEAFKTDTWQPRQSGLCHGWCPVTTCEFWRPKRNR
jgi:hypothetical protein